MDMYNRYLMRVFGEQKHQPRGPAETATFAVIDYLKRKACLSNCLFKGLSEEDKNKIMEEIRSLIQNSIDNP